MKILVTGAAGFIGYHLCKKLLTGNNYVYGIDNINNYYDVNLKNDRIKILKKNNNFFFYKKDLQQFNWLTKNFSSNNYDVVIHLAAQAGVRYSLENPKTYLDNNINVFFNILELTKKFKIKHLLYASTSSVYGNSKKFPLKEDYPTDKPLSFYAATKKCNEIMAETYSNLYNFQCSGLRFFTVYGDYGRPDMALFKFTKAILNNKKIDLYNKGEHYRDFTYVDDVVYCISKLISKKHKINHEIFNIGNSNPQYLMKFISIIEENLSLKAKYKKMNKQIGDVEKNHANINKITKLIGANKKINIHEGIKKFINWYKGYYK